MLKPPLVSSPWRDVLLALLVVCAWSAWDMSSAALVAEQSTNTSAKCVNGVSSNGVCFCEAGWTGSACDKKIEEAPTACVNGVALYGRCFCTAGWGGEACDQKLESEPLVCSGHGVAFNGKCFCNPGYAGAACEVVDMPLACEHGVAKFDKCFCEPGWTGERCDELVSVVIPRVECVSVDPTNPNYAIARFGYESYAGNVSPVTNVVVINGNVTPYAPKTFTPGINTNAFSVRFKPALESVEWMINGVSVSPAGTSKDCDAPGLKGEKGDRGEPGLNGSNGLDGRDGKDGKDGKDGVPGIAGPQGPPGNVGPRGPTGHGLRFVTVPINVSGQLVMPSAPDDLPSAIFLVGSAEVKRSGGPIELTLPRAADSAARFVTITRGGDRRIIVRASASDAIEGVRRLLLDNENRSVTLVSDGTRWFVLLEGK